MANLIESVKIDKLNRTVGGKKSSSQLLNLRVSGTATSTFNLASGSSATFIASLTNDFDLRLFGTVHISLYQDSVSSANRIPEGSNVTNFPTGSASVVLSGGQDSGTTVVAHNETGKVDFEAWVRVGSGDRGTVPAIFFGFVSGLIRVVKLALATSSTTQLKFTAAHDTNQSGETFNFDYRILAGYEFNHWLDWGKLDTGNTKLKLVGNIKNRHPDTKTIVIRVNWRYIVEGATSSI